MKKNSIDISIKTLLLAIFILLISDTGFGQTKKVVTPKKPTETVKVVETVVTEKRPVTVYLKEGDPLKGTFVNASSDGVQILIAGNTLTLKWNDISQIVFTDVVSNEVITKNNKNNTETENNEAIEGALKSLRKLAAATEVGVNFQEYGSRLIDVKAEVSEFLPKITDGFVKEEIKLAMEAYADAATAWNWTIVNHMGDMFPDFEPGKTLQQKYSIPTYRWTSDSNLMARDKVLSTIWAAARKYIENASTGETNKETK